MTGPACQLVRNFIANISCCAVNTYTCREKCIQSGVNCIRGGCQTSRSRIDISKSDRREVNCRENILLAHRIDSPGSCGAVVLDYGISRGRRKKLEWLSIDFSKNLAVTSRVARGPADRKNASLVCYRFGAAACRSEAPHRPVSAILPRLTALPHQPARCTAKHSASPVAAVRCGHSEQQHQRKSASCPRVPVPGVSAASAPSILPLSHLPPNAFLRQGPKLCLLSSVRSCQEACRY